MHARQEHTIIITMSPRELRDLADKMEKRWTELKVGQTTFVDFLHHADGPHDTAIVLHLDQMYFHELEKPVKVLPSVDALAQVAPGYETKPSNAQGYPELAMTSAEYNSLRLCTWPHYPTTSRWKESVAGVACAGWFVGLNSNMIHRARITVTGA